MHNQYSLGLFCTSTLINSLFRFQWQTARRQFAPHDLLQRSNCRNCGAWTRKVAIVLRAHWNIVSGFVAIFQQIWHFFAKNDRWNYFEEIITWFLTFLTTNVTLTILKFDNMPTCYLILDLYHFMNYKQAGCLLNVYLICKFSVTKVINGWIFWKFNFFKMLKHWSIKIIPNSWKIYDHFVKTLNLILI